jgi:hypothetical protein
VALRLAGGRADAPPPPALASPGFVRIAQQNVAGGFAKSESYRSADFPPRGVILRSIAAGDGRTRNTVRRSAAISVAGQIRDSNSDGVRACGGLAQRKRAPLEILHALVDAGLNLPLMEGVGENEADKLGTVDLIASGIVPNLKIKLRFIGSGEMRES